MKNSYENAYTEVCEILNCLNEEEYSKIPTELIEAFEKNKNPDYEYEVNEEQDLLKQPMLRETKAILLNIYRDYLATPEQSKKLKEWLQADRNFVERQKLEKYRAGKMFQSSDSTFIEGANTALAVGQRSFYKQVIDRIKRYLNIYR